jgi:MazG family protein
VPRLSFAYAKNFMTKQNRFQELTETIAKLRDPKDGCPWDIEQTHQSIRQYLLEETYEVLEAIDKKDDKELQNELGDLLLQVMLHSQIAKDRKAFDIENVIEAINEKMIRRHPHVFGNTSVKNSQEVKKNWEEIKQKERTRENRKPSLLEGLPLTMPALGLAQRIGEKAAKVNFDWPTTRGVIEKVREELGELEDELHNKEIDRERLEHELGDVFFSLCQLARHLEISSEDSLRNSCRRFVKRFQMMESQIDTPLSKLPIEELEKAWEKAKKTLGS